MHDTNKFFIASIKVEIDQLSHHWFQRVMYVEFEIVLFCKFNLFFVSMKVWLPSTDQNILTQE